MVSKSPTSPDDRVAAALELLHTEVEKLSTGEDWRRYLDVQSRLHCYSPRNATLIAAQHLRAFVEGRAATPDPQMIAGYQTWLALGRRVERGQHGYGILAPVHIVRRTAIGPSNETRQLRRGQVAGSGEREEHRRILSGFKIQYVFDLSQTAGRALPIPPLPRLLMGQAPAGLGQSVTALIEKHGFEVSTVPNAEAIEGANGVTDWLERTVRVRSDMDDAAIVKTLLHEAGHVLLHGMKPGRVLPRAVKEVEAESVAYVVASAHGMATDDYTFPYVTHWAGGEDAPAAVLASQDRIAGAARQILAVSTAPHSGGGRPLDVSFSPEHAVASAGMVANLEPSVAHSQPRPGL